MSSQARTRYKRRTGGSEGARSACPHVRLRRMPFTGKIRYDRRVSQEFLAHFRQGGVAHSLTEYAAKARYPVDLQMRHNPKTEADHASLYVGLTSVLNVVAKAKPVSSLALTAHKTWSEGPYGFDLGWRDAVPADDWTKRWIEVEEYLEKVIPSASVTHGQTEGAVQAAASAFSDGSRVMLDREVTPHFLDTLVKKSVLGPISNSLVDALAEANPVPGKPPASFGAECDLLALDRDGRLLAVEVKPSVSSLVWTPAQATMYSSVLKAWVDDDGAGSPGWRAVVLGMLEQRRQLGLAPRFHVELPEAPVVVPVIAVQRGASSELLARLWKVQQALLNAGVGDPALEVYQVSLSGRLDRIHA